MSQFSDVKKKTKEKTRGKKDVPGGSEAATNSTRGRARGGLESVRGGRGRGSDRGGRGRGGRGGSTTNGARSASAAVSVPTTETTGWGAAPTTSIAVGGVDGTVNTEPWDQSAGAGDDSWADKTSNDAAPNSEILKSSLIPSGTKKSWASMLSAPKAPPVVPKPQAPVQAQHAANAPPAEISAASSASLTGDVAKDLTQTPPAASLSATDLGIELAPPKDKLTEDNLEHLPDESQPIASETVASTRDASSVVGSGTPFAASQQGPGAARPPLGGYATTAWKAAGTPGRSASFQKKILEQREAVVMPGNHAVDRAAVQFGSMGLNGDGKPLDVDDDREETQTRAPVAHSPPSQPRASLPPASHPHAAGPETMGHAHEGGPTPKQAPGLPFSGQQPPPSSAGPGAQQGPYGGQYGRYGAGTLGQETASTGQKPYDAFAQQVNYGQTQDPSSIFPNNSQAANASAPTQSHGGYSQNPSEYSSQYGGDQQRFQNYYGGGYGQQGHHASHQEQNVGPQRSGSAFAGAEPAYAANQPGASQSRFNENQNTSGHTTPNPALSSQQGSGQSQQVHHAQGQPQGQAAQGGGYPYGNPYYSGSYYGGGSYMNQVSDGDSVIDLVTCANGRAVLQQLLQPAAGLRSAVRWQGQHVRSAAPRVRHVAPDLVRAVCLASQRRWLLEQYEGQRQCPVRGAWGVRAVRVDAADAAEHLGLWLLHRERGRIVRPRRRGGLLEPAVRAARRNPEAVWRRIKRRAQPFAEPARPSRLCDQQRGLWSGSVQLPTATAATVPAGLWRLPEPPQPGVRVRRNRRPRGQPSRKCSEPSDWRLWRLRRLWK